MWCIQSGGILLFELLVLLLSLDEHLLKFLL